MNVLMTTDTLGGVWTYSLELAAGLTRRGVTVSLAAMGRQLSPDQRREVGALDGVRLYASDHALEWMAEPWADVERAGEWLLELASATAPDVVHLNGYVHAQLPWPAPVVVVAHSDVLSWLHHVRGEQTPPDRERYRDEVERGLGAAELVVAPTAAVIRDLERHYRFDAPRVVIANGRTPVPTRPKEPFVLAAGRAWDDAKNIRLLERLAPDLPWPVRVADGTVPRRGTDELLGRASVFAAPALYEPFGLAPLEAASAGCALVLADIESFREVWEDAALYVDPRDEAEVRAALRRVIDDAALRADLSRRARDRGARYTPQAMAARYADAYEQVTLCHLQEEVPA